MNIAKIVRRRMKGIFLLLLSIPCLSASDSVQHQEVALAREIVAVREKLAEYKISSSFFLPAERQG